MLIVISTFEQDCRYEVITKTREITPTKIKAEDLPEGIRLPDYAADYIKSMDH